MRYRNTKTGVVIDVSCQLSGSWEPAEAPVAEEKQEAPAKPAKKRTVKK